MRMLPQVFREFSIDWILHCNVRMFSMDTDMDMDTWTWPWTCTSRKQWVRFCTWRDARLERAMS